jgi:hypothetical protein
MKKELKELYGYSRKVHQESYKRLLALERLLTQEGELTELGDAVFALRKTEELLEDARKECGKLLTLMEKLTCLRWLATSKTHEPIRTEYCTASPDVKQTVSVPPKDSDDYKSLLKHFEIPDGAPFMPHWPSLLKRVSADIAAGQPIPPGCDPSKMVQVCVVRTLKKKRPILDEGEAPALEDPEVLRRSYALFDALWMMPWVPLKNLADALMAPVDEARELINADYAAEENADVQTENEILADAERRKAAVSASDLPGAPSFMDEDCGTSIKSSEKSTEESTPF